MTSASYCICFFRLFLSIILADFHRAALGHFGQSDLSFFPFLLFVFVYLAEPQRDRPACHRPPVQHQPGEGQHYRAAPRQRRPAACLASRQADHDCKSAEARHLAALGVLGASSARCRCVGRLRSILLPGSFVCYVGTLLIACLSVLQTPVDAIVMAHGEPYVGRSECASALAHAVSGLRQH